jgi:WD40 repeat protein
VASGKEIAPLPKLEKRDFASVEASPDGKILAFGDWEGQVHLCDADTGSEIRRFKGHKQFVVRVTFSPDGKALASGAEFDQAACVWDVATGKLLHRFEAGSQGPISVSFSMDGKRLATASSDGVVGIRDLSGNEKPQSIKIDNRIGSHTVAIMKDGKKVAVGSEYGMIHVWDLDSSKAVVEIRPAKRGDASAPGLVVLPDGKILVSHGNKLELWDESLEHQLEPFPDQDGAGANAVVSHDGKTVAAGRSTISLWDIPSRRRLFPMNGHMGQIFHLAYSRDGRFVTSVSYGPLRIWDPATGRQLQLLQHGILQHGNPILLCPDDRRAIHPSTKEAATGVFVNLASGKELGKFQGSFYIGFCHAFSPDGTLLATGDPIGLWDLEKGQKLREFTGHQNHTMSIAFSPDGRTLASAGSDRTVRLWEVDTAKQITIQKWDGTKEKETGAITPEWIPDSVAFTLDGKSLVIAGGRTLIFLTPLPDGKAKLRFEEVKRGCYSMAISPDGQTLAVADFDCIRLLELPGCKERGKLEGNHRVTRAIAFSPDGSTLASAGDDTAILIWDVREASTVKPLSLADCWEALDKPDAARAAQALRALAAESEKAIPFVAQRLKALATPKAKIPQLIKDLDAAAFDVREKATAELEKLGGEAEPALRQLLADEPSPEARRRAASLLELAAAQAILLPPERLRALRALTLLERLATSKAHKVLKDLATSSSGSPISLEAKAAIKRLEKQPLLAR